MSGKPSLELKHHAALAPPSSDLVSVIASTGIGPSGELLVLWTSPADAAALASVTEQPGWATFPDSKPSSPATGQLAIYDPALVTVLDLEDIPVAFPKLQPLPGGRVLAVGVRCHWHPEGPDQNVVAYDSQGHIESSGIFGDGIEHLMTTPNGDVWVGYSDEGIFGNYGWGAPSGPEPIGACGLIRFGNDLSAAWRFPADGPWGSIDDCYALNVTAEDAWACYYSDFPIVHISRGTVRGWDNPIHSARAMLVNGNDVGFVGGADADELDEFEGIDPSVLDDASQEDFMARLNEKVRQRYNRFVRGSLASDSFVPESEARVVLPDGEPPPPNSFVGRGNELHAIVDNGWYKFALE